MHYISQSSDNPVQPCSVPVMRVYFWNVHSNCNIMSIKNQHYQHWNKELCAFLHLLVGRGDLQYSSTCRWRKGSWDWETGSQTPAMKYRVTLKPLQLLHSCILVNPLGSWDSSLPLSLSADVSRISSLMTWEISQLQTAACTASSPTVTGESLTNASALVPYFSFSPQRVHRLNRENRRQHTQGQKGQLWQGGEPATNFQRSSPAPQYKPHPSLPDKRAPPPHS